MIFKYSIGMGWDDACGGRMWKILARGGLRRNDEVRRLSPIDLLQLSTKNTRQIRSFVTHGIFVNGSKLLKGLQSKIFGQVLYHTKHAIIQGAINLTCGLEIL
jgi:hypothetical protein